MFALASSGFSNALVTTTTTSGLDSESLVVIAVAATPIVRDCATNSKTHGAMAHALLSLREKAENVAPLQAAHFPGFSK